jgi:gluconate 2-dehydrogenase gamma chain
MADGREEHERAGLTRRDLLKQIGVAGAALSVPSQVSAASAAAAEPGGPGEPEELGEVGEAVQRAALEALTAAEADLLDAVCARIIPSDANGPGAREARAVRYIDRALGGALAGSREAYRAGLAALDRYSRSSRRAPFTELSARDQDSVLIDVETGAATGFPGGSAAFFAMVRTHTLQGTFGDPYYGGNADFIGWDLLGYPGIRLAVTAEDQRLGARLAPTHKSAYDHDMFTKATASHRDGAGGAGPASRPQAASARPRRGSPESGRAEAAWPGGAGREGAGREVPHATD